MHPKKADWATKQTDITLVSEESLKQGKESWGNH